MTWAVPREALRTACCSGAPVVCMPWMWDTDSSEWRLRQDPRVVLMERTNIRHLPPDAIPEPIDLIVIDVSFFISPDAGLALCCALSHPSDSIITLICRNSKWERTRRPGRIVRDDGLQRGLRTRSLPVPRLWGWIWLVVWSRLSRAKGNRKFLPGFATRPDQGRMDQRRVVPQRERGGLATCADENPLLKLAEGVG